MKSDPIDGGDQVATGQRVDVAALQAENAALLRRNSELQHSRRTGWLGALRATAVVALLVVGTVLATVSVPAIWGRNLILNTDRYVETLTPLADDAGLQSAVVKAIDAQFSAHIDVKALAENVLPPKASALAGPLASAAASLVNTIATKFVQSDAFKTLWVTINRAAHTQLVAVLTGTVTDSSAINFAGGTVTLDLASVVAAVKQRLVDAGLAIAAKVPTVGATIELVQVKGIDKARGAVRLLDRSAHWLPLLAIAFLLGAVFAARHRRRTIIAAAMAVGGGMVVLAIAVAAGRGLYLDALPGTYLSRDAASHVFDLIVRYLRLGLRLVLLGALIVVVTAWLTGPSRAAVGTRSWLSRAERSVLAWISHSRLANAIAQNRGTVSMAVIAVAGLVLVLWTNPTPLVIVLILAVTALAVVVATSLRSTGHESARADPLIPPG